MKTETSQIHRILQELQAGWLARSGSQFAAAFAPQARFVAFDGTTLTGPSEIANFHQRAFDSHLRGTALDVHIDEIRLVAPGVRLVRTKGGIMKANGSVVEWEKTRTKLALIGPDRRAPATCACGGQHGMR